jgi:hypothetical protein
MKPFALPSASQFRPEPPISLKSQQWATDYNEIKDLGMQDQHQALAAADWKTPASG